MQGGHDWYETLGTMYNELGYTISRADPCVRFKEEDENYAIMDTYRDTDDIFGASNDDEEIQTRKDEVGKQKMWGETEYFLGMRVEQDIKSEQSNLLKIPNTESMYLTISATCQHWNDLNMNHIGSNGQMSESRLLSTQVQNNEIVPLLEWMVMLNNRYHCN